ncbi:biotin--[acetyl-CoA-carboxylase] ligase [Hoyosella rhizosphaerae]|uniref:biotin--[biotin carboxyl-carrier protein] ligase n=2 Tax=Hoyosella rhizosphaerae TaxID=1755582 RepID=A0A916XF67_9ACTN|nr:biotin--[acetyl-CoA-carboxylase] ligase [Hoyosella rhizosphaerae]
MDVERIRSELLSQPHRPLWRTVDLVDETGSTNADLLARARGGTSEAVLFAENQTSGRGRHDRTWLTPPGYSLITSVVVTAHSVTPDKLGWIPLITGVSLATSLRRVAGVDAVLKWPNDVMVGERKIAGVLAEIASVPGSPRVVIGFGINVAHAESELPVPHATSLFVETGRAIDRNVLAVDVLTQLSADLTGWLAASGATADVGRRYRALCGTLGRRVSVELPNDTVTGVAESVDDVGCLRIRRTGQENQPGGGVLTVSAGDVTHLRGAQ